jgi:carbon-monoxide dehydrogenase large subunit
LAHPYTRDVQGQGEDHAPGRWIGANIAKKDAHLFVSGKIEYTADLIRPGTLYVSVLRSRHAHAAIRGIECEEARRAPGVVAVLTGADIRKLTRPMPTRVPRERFPGPIDVWCLAFDEAIYVGQPLVAVVAERQADAEAAKSLLRIDYAPMDAVLDARVGAKPDSPRARSAWTTNIVFQDKIRQGDTDAAMQKAGCVVKGRMSFGSATSAPMECRCYIAGWNAAPDALDAVASARSAGD